MPNIPASSSTEIEPRNLNHGKIDRRRCKRSPNGRGPGRVGAALGRSGRLGISAPGFSKSSSHVMKSSRSDAGPSTTACVPKPSTHPRNRAGSSTTTVIRRRPSDIDSVSTTRVSHHDIPAARASTMTVASRSDPSTLCTRCLSSRLPSFFLLALETFPVTEKSAPMRAHLIARIFFSPTGVAIKYHVPLSKSRRSGSTTIFSESIEMSTS